MAEKIKTFNERVVLAQNELKAPKGQMNRFGGYAYRSAEDILEAVKPINLKHELLLNLKDEIIEVGGRIYVKAIATLHDVHSDLKIEVQAVAREAETKKGMDDSQITGSASSYARKYALNGLYLIDDTKDSDTNEHAETQNNAPRNEPKQEVKPATDIQKSGLKKPLFQKQILAELSFTSSFRLLFTLNRGLLIMLSLANLLNNAVLCGLPFKTAQSVIKRLVLFNSNLTHLYSLPPQNSRGLNSIARLIILYFVALVKKYF